MMPALVRWREGLAGAALALALAHTARAQTRGCAAGKAGDSASVVRRWSAPLDRPVTLHAADLSLRDALDRVAALAGIRLSYSAELLPLDRRVCANADAAPAGRVLEDLLSATNVVPVTAGGDQVVLSPRPPQSGRADAAPELARSVGMLDRVVVTGSAVSAPARESSVDLDVVPGEKLRRENVNSMSEALDAFVPGMWSWAQSPANMLNSYASIRGASSFGLSYPKIYIDGIEVANPLLLSRFNATSIDRIEVIRGPQGSALYGTDAISGVINIVTRHEGTGDHALHAELRSTAGMSESAYAHDVLAQDHTLALVSGSSTRSADLHVEAGSMGAFVPDGYSRELLANGAARVVGASGTLSTTARLYVEQAGAGNSLVTIDRPATAVDSFPGSQQTSRSPQSVTEYTLGTNATVFGGERWTHSFVAGIDGYRLANVQTNYTPVPSVVDSALRAAQGGADRGTIRASSVLHLDAGEPTRATLTLSAEHAALRLSALEPSRLLAADRMPHASVVERSATTWQNSTGVSAQVNVAVDDLFFATGGMRVERDSRLAADERIAALPMLGVAAVRDYGPLNVKLRASFGKGIRPPTTVARWQLLQPGIIGQQTPLGPEVQSGTEVGLDVALQRVLSFQLTRFDQHASGLIQQVAVGVDSGPQARRMAYAAENVGEIANSGWEMEATGAWSRLSATGALTFVDSRVQRVAAGYTGDLMAGDRMLQVPARTASLNVGWTAPDWHAALTGSRALDWINYDELALAEAWTSGSRAARDFVGPQLRDYWRRYNGGLRLRASASRDVRPDLSFEFSVDNLLNYQRGEPDNITIVPGRTIMTGVRITF
jgi:iron complex outermembrane receptor protein